MRNFSDEYVEPENWCTYILPNGKECGLPTGCSSMDLCPMHLRRKGMTYDEIVSDILEED